jgi:5'-3' exonuclease
VIDIMIVHLLDGTYELFRCFFGAPSSWRAGREVGASRAFLRSLASWLESDEERVVGCAFDHVIESFRNDLYAGYKTAEGVDPDLLAQFDLAEEITRALGIVTWPMIEFEADDALASAAKRFARAKSVRQVRLCSPDKDLAQCVRDRRIVLFDRRTEATLDEGGVREKFGVPPASIPDWLALVGDSADGIPGVPRWGAKSAAAVLGRYRKLEAIPDEAAKWTVPVRGAAGLAESLKTHRREALLYRTLATLREDVPIAETLADLRWRGPHREGLKRVCAEVDAPDVLSRLCP